MHVIFARSLRKSKGSSSTRIFLPCQMQRIVRSPQPLFYGQLLARLARLKSMGVCGTNITQGRLICDSARPLPIGLLPARQSLHIFEIENPASLARLLAQSRGPEVRPKIPWYSTCQVINSVALSLVLAVPGEHPSGGRDVKAGYSLGMSGLEDYYRFSDARYSRHASLPQLCSHGVAAKYVLPSFPLLTMSLAIRARALRCFQALVRGHFGYNVLIPRPCMLIQNTPISEEEKSNIIFFNLPKHIRPPIAYPSGTS